MRIVWLVDLGFGGLAAVGLLAAIIAAVYLAFVSRRTKLASMTLGAG